MMKTGIAHWRFWKSTMPNYMAKIAGEQALTIPCKSDPDLCMQLDAWMPGLSVPAILNGEHSVLFRNHCTI